MMSLWRALKSAILIALVLGVCSSFGDGSGNEYKLLMPGDYDSSKISYTKGEVWYALFKTDKGHVLEQVELRASACPIPMVGKLGDTGGTRITLNHPWYPLMLISGPGNLEAGELQTHFSGDDPITVGRYTYLGHESVLTALGRVIAEDRRHPSDLVTVDYQAQYSKHPYSSSDRQILVETERTAGRNTPSLLWAGDLDRDGKTDLLLNMGSNSAGRQFGLFLSSEAEAGQLVKLVAVLQAMGC